MKACLAVLFTLICVFAGAAEDPSAKLQRQIDLLDSIKPYVERQDLGRLLILRQATTKVIETLGDKGPLHTATAHAYHNLIVRYRFSRVYFTDITTAGTEAAIKEIQDIAENIATIIGFDDDPSTRITYSIFYQMHDLMRQLLQMAIPGELREKVTARIPEIGEFIGFSKGGDTLPVFQGAIPQTEKIRELYPLFNQVVASDRAYHLVLEIQGLNELMIERARLPLNKKPLPQE
jgi:hypothetical protein